MSADHEVLPESSAAGASTEQTRRALAAVNRFDERARQRNRKAGIVFLTASVLIPLAAALITADFVQKAKEAVREKRAATTELKEITASRVTATKELEIAQKSAEDLQRQVTALEKRAKANADAVVAQETTIAHNTATIEEQQKKIADLGTSASVSTSKAVNTLVRVEARLKAWMTEDKPIPLESVRTLLGELKTRQDVLGEAADLVTLSLKGNLSPAEQERASALSTKLTPPPAPAPEKTAPSTAGRVQFLLGGGPADEPERRQRLQRLEEFARANQYDIESGRTNISTPPSMVEVRYYHLPEGQAQAESFLKMLKDGHFVKSGRTSYVLDPRQPKGNLQVAFPSDPAEKAVRAADEWVVAIGFGTNFHTNKERAENRQRALLQTSAGRNLPVKILENDDDYAVVIGPYPNKKKAEEVTSLLKTNSELTRALKEAGAVHLILPRLEEYEISKRFEGYRPVRLPN